MTTKDTRLGIAPLTAKQTMDAEEFGIVFSHASEAIGELVSKYSTMLEAIRQANLVLDAQPGIEAVLVYRSAGDWFDRKGRSPRQIIDEEWANPTTSGWHISRTFGGPDGFTVDCPCKVATCGYAVPSSDCPQHSLSSGKTIRASHHAENCIGATV